jgi:hypothetical protein
MDTTVERLLQHGKLDRREVISLYKENLRIVKSRALKLIEILPGNTVITGDHGEMFGERAGFLYPFRTFGHPGNLHVKPLVVVPWLIVPQNDEKRSLSVGQQVEAQVGSNHTDEEKVKERLRKLGYL